MASTTSKPPNGNAGTANPAAAANPDNAAHMFGAVSEEPFTFSPFIQLGRSGLKQYGGFVQEEFVPVLRGKQGAKSYREILDNSALVGGIFKLIQLTMRQVERYVEPFSEDAEDVKRAERIEQALNDMSHSWEDTISEVCTMLPYGYAPMELIYKKCQGWTDDPSTRSRYNDGLIMWRKIALRAQDTLFRWEFDAEGGVRAFIQLPPPDFQTRVIPIEKLLLFRPEVEKGNPEGKSVLRSGYFNWQMIKRLIEFEAIRGERDAVGIPVAYIPAANMSARATAEQIAVYTQMKKVVQNIRTDDQMGIVMPMAYDPITNQPLYKLELLTSSARAIFDYDKVIVRHEVRLAMSMLADVMMLGHDKVGSFALSQDKHAMLADGLGAWLDSICDIFNRHAIPRIFNLNGWPLDRICHLKHGAIEEADVDVLATAAQKLSQAGMALFPDDKLENHLRAELGWPEKRLEGDLVDANEPQPDRADQNADPAERLSEQQEAQVAPKPGLGAKVQEPTSKATSFTRPRANRGTWAQRSGSVANALDLLRDRHATGANDRVAHGFRTANPIPFDPEAMMHVLDIEKAPFERLPLKSLIATQPNVRRETVRAFIENPDMVSHGQRSLTGQPIDRPVVIRHNGDNYIADGHHRLAAKLLLGYPDTLARVVGESESLPANQGQPYNPGMQKSPPWKIVQHEGKYQVVGIENGKVFGTHDTHDEAVAQMRALYANVPDARK